MADQASRRLEGAGAARGAQARCWSMAAPCAFHCTRRPPTCCSPAMLHPCLQTERAFQRQLNVQRG